MITIYNANSSIDAKLIQDQLSFDDIPSQILGDLLQGGIGELQTQGLIKVVVAEEDFDKAKKNIERWEEKTITTSKHDQLNQIKNSKLSFKFVMIIVVPLIFIALYLLFTNSANS